MNAVAVVGQALTADGGSANCRGAAVLVARPLTTVRGWLRRARAVVAQLAVHFTGWSHRLDANLGPIAPSGSVLADALAAIGAAARAASLRWRPARLGRGPRPSAAGCCSPTRAHPGRPPKGRAPSSRASGSKAEPCLWGGKIKYRDRATEVALFRYVFIREPADPGAVQDQEGRVGAGAGRHRPSWLRRRGGEGRPVHPGRLESGLAWGLRGAETQAKGAVAHWGSSLFPMTAQVVWAG